MVIRWTYTFQRRIHVDSTSTSTLRLVRWIFLRRFYVEKYLCGHGIFFNFESTSILRRKVSAQTLCIFNVDSTLNFHSTRTVDSSTSNINRFHVDASPTVFVDFSKLNTSGTLRSPMMSLLPSLALYTSAQWDISSIWGNLIHPSFISVFP